MTQRLIIGATSLVGQRLRDIVPQAAFTTRKPKQANDLFLDLMHPQAFEGDGFAHVIVTSPLWLITESVLEVLWAQGMKRLVAFSSTSRFSKTYSPQPEERYVVELLSEAEARIEAFCATHDVDWTVLRPTLIYDEGRDQNISRIATTIDRLGVFPVCGPASGLRQPVHARDLAKAAVDVLSTEATADRAYNLSGGETLSYRDMVARIFASKGKPAHILSLPEGAWRLGFGVLGVLRPGSALKGNVQMALRMNTDLVFDHSAATRDFGYGPGIFKPEFGE
ncbi:NAD-dependent epimerase/dehydratase family protein [Asticcacaulis excentricus]|uniref:NAD-dependent epimerase/dehydratase n=1 Tax=Asticcacaulis excentricus (strain ATCC 15261 / DSM 4724 / KCTC 12464 / NCIMB 9791 / VKM B-1370 / CB 48) TaxID=573065 RepID=E8RTL6_ASTEC|nr:NAD-dependent epimerase/dehydratase family protein [Asticcacaulis excentricus]ADU14837.1 NAD-dependent epimerase/dehydratase [Asticcacaulis excentricus CB 48]